MAFPAIGIAGNLPHSIKQDEVNFEINSEWKFWFYAWWIYFPQSGALAEVHDH
jgi:hypothetical protein